MSSGCFIICPDRIFVTNISHIDGPIRCAMQCVSYIHDVVDHGTCHTNSCAEWKLDARAPALMNEIHQEYVFTIDHTGKRNEWKRNRIDRRCAPMKRCLCIDGFPKLLIAVWTAEPDQRKCNHEFTPNVVKYVPDEYRCFAALVWFAYAKIIWFAVIRTMQVTKSCATKLSIYFQKMQTWLALRSSLVFGHAIRSTSFCHLWP